MFRVPWQHLPFAERRSRDAASGEPSEACAQDRGRLGRHRQLAYGQPPDERAQRAARKRGYDLSLLRGRQIGAEDFARFDLLIAMDDANAVALTDVCPPEYRGKIRLLMEFATRDGSRVVVDPYFGGDEGFERVLDQCEDACEGLLKAFRTQLVV
jgi:protein-tyrosine phosphatase